MSEESKNMERWLKTAKKEGAKYVLDVMDGFDYSHYPVYVSADEDLSEVRAKYSGNMQRVYSEVEVK